MGRDPTKDNTKTKVSKYKILNRPTVANTITINFLQLPREMVEGPIQHVMHRCFCETSKCQEIHVLPVKHGPSKAEAVAFLNLKQQNRDYFHKIRFEKLVP